MTLDFEDYRLRYRSIHLERADGVLTMTLHTRGGPAMWGASRDSLHAELGGAFADIARDPANKVVVLTGTGDAFLDRMDPDDRPDEDGLAAMWPRIYREGLALLGNLLAVPVPMIGAVNGPALIHAEIAMLCDIVLAAETAVFADAAHVPAGAVPGDGVQIVWPALLGPNRGRYFLLTGERIDAAEALRLGLVGEILPRERLMDRAAEHARALARLPVEMLRHTRAVLVRDLRRRMADGLDFGLAAEALATLTR